MALTAQQKRALPASAFVYHSGPRSSWRYPIPSKAQARRAGISEASRLRTARSALSYAGHANTAGSYAKVARVVKARTGAAIPAVGGPRGTTSHAGYARRHR